MKRLYAGPWERAFDGWERRTVDGAVLTVRHRGGGWMATVYVEDADESRRALWTTPGFGAGSSRQAMAEAQVEYRRRVLGTTS
jgi:hypothetical protein